MQNRQGMLKGISGDNDWVEGADGVYNTTDNIGIGTTNPEAKLNVKGSGFPVKIEHPSGGKYVLFAKGQYLIKQ